MSDEQSRNLVAGGRIVAFSDEGFAPSENLLAVRVPEFRFGVFVSGRGQEFDSWETRRHNPNPPDWVILELGTPGPIATVDVDTHWHDGNHAERAALYGLVGEPGENPSRDDARWTQILPMSRLDGHAHNVFRTPAGVGTAWTHVMLENDPDGGIARLRCYSDRAPEAVDPPAGAPRRRVRHEEKLAAGTDVVYHPPSEVAIAAAWETLEPGAPIDLAREALGAHIVATSNNRYGHSHQLLADSVPVSMGDGWETSRSRGDGHYEYVTVALARRGVVERIEVDFTYFPLNNPCALRLLGVDVEAGADLHLAESWVELLPHTPVKALAGDVLRVESDALAARGPFTHVRLEAFPDGGANRLHVFGRPVES